MKTINKVWNVVFIVSFLVSILSGSTSWASWNMAGVVWNIFFLLLMCTFYVITLAWNEKDWDCE